MTPVGYHLAESARADTGEKCRRPRWHDRLEDVRSSERLTPSAVGLDDDIVGEIEPSIAAFGFYAAELVGQRRPRRCQYRTAAVQRITQIGGQIIRFIRTRRIEQRHIASLFTAKFRCRRENSPSAELTAESEHGGRLATATDDAHQFVVGQSERCDQTVEFNHRDALAASQLSSSRRGPIAKR